MLKTSCDSLLMSWSFAKTFRHSFAKLFFSFAGMNSTKTSFASFRGGPCHLMKESQAFIKGPTSNTWDLIHLPDPKVAVCEGRAWFRYLSFREAFAQLSRHFRGFRAMGGTTCYCANLKMHLHNITCNFISRHITLLSRTFAREHCYKLFRKSFAASILAFAEPSDINSLTTQYMSGFRRCSFGIPTKINHPLQIWGMSHFEFHIHFKDIKSFQWLHGIFQQKKCEKLPCSTNS